MFKVSIIERFKLTQNKNKNQERDAGIWEIIDCLIEGNNSTNFTSQMYQLINIKKYIIMV